MKSILIAISLFLISFVAVQAQQGIPQEEIMRLHSEALMNGDAGIFDNFYHDDVQIYKFPNILLADGKDQAIDYWKNNINLEVPMVYEQRSMIEAGKKYIVEIVKIEPANENKRTQTAHIFVMEGDKIYRLMMLD